MTVNSITIDMVNKFVISSACRLSDPCTHTCQIFLKDLRETRFNLSSPEIHVLFTAFKTAGIHVETSCRGSHFEEGLSSPHWVRYGGPEKLKSAEAILKGLSFH